MWARWDFYLDDSGDVLGRFAWVVFRALHTFTSAHVSSYAGMAAVLHLLTCQQFLNSTLTGAMVYLQALLIGMCYTACQDMRGATAHFYIITIPAQMMPYCLLLVQLLFPNGVENLKIGLTGLVAAHLHDFLTRIYPEFGNGPNLIPTPAFISYFMITPRIQNTGFGTAIRPKTNAAGSGGPLPDAWRSKGPGRRLG